MRCKSGEKSGVIKMLEKMYPTLKDVKEMTVAHGRLTAVDRHSHSNGMMMFSGVSDKFTLKETDGEWVVLHEHKNDMDGTDEKLYRADAAALEKIAQIAEEENLYAWGEMRIDPEKDDRPKVYDYSSSAGITLYTDDRVGGYFSFNCDTARFYGGGKVIDEINAIIGSFVTDENLIRQKHLPVTDPRVIEMKNKWFPDLNEPKAPDTSADTENGWGCGECGARGSEGKYCANCGAPKPSEKPGEWVYTGEKWVCPGCGQDGNEGKFCCGCGNWRPDLAPKSEEVETAQNQPVQPSEAARQFGIPSGITDALKAAGMFPEDKPDEQLAALLAKQASHGRLVSFEHSAWSNGMSVNSHSEDRTTAVFKDGGAVVTRYIQQGTFDAAVTEFTAGEKVIAELEGFIREKNLTNLEALRYDSSRDPFGNMTDTSGGSQYSIMFDDSSAGGSSLACFTLDTAAIVQHGGSEITAQLRTFCDRLCSEGVITSSRREPPAQRGMLGFAGMLGAVSEGGSVGGSKWVCGECGFENSGGKFCNSCGSPKK